MLYIVLVPNISEINLPVSESSVSTYMKLDCDSINQAKCTWLETSQISNFFAEMANILLDLLIELS